MQPAFGISLVHHWQEQDLDVTSFHLQHTPTSPLESLSSQPQVHLENLEQKSEFTGVVVDAWILPFTNVYITAGLTRGESRGTVVVAPSLLQPAGERRAFRRSYYGNTLGAGLALVGGWRGLFGRLDGHYAETDLNISSQDAQSVTVTLRWGHRFRVGESRGALWFGALHQDIAQTTETTSAEHNTRVSVGQRAADPWSYLVGVSWSLPANFRASVEMGAKQRRQASLTITYRF